MKFLVVTNAPTIFKDNYYSSYAPYVKEMDLWFKNIGKMGILSPVKYPEEVFLQKFEIQDIRLFRMPFLGFRNTKEIIFFFLYLPITIPRFFKAFVWADHLHLRCPSNFGLIGSVIQIFFPGKLKSVKYAGNWAPQAKEPWSYRLQKWILSNTFLTRNMQVLVYGQWPNQTKNVLPFFTASFSETEIEKIERDFNPPYKLLFVGNLVSGKQPQLAIQLVEALNEKNIPADLHVYGDGVLKNELEMKAENKDYIHLHGNQPLDIVKQAYKDSHFLILASKSEGWPKAVAEAMFYGCIPIVSAVSCVPWMLNYGSRGILIPEGKVDSGNPPLRFGQGGKRNLPAAAGVDSQNVLGKEDSGGRAVLDETVDKIIELLKYPEEMKRMSREAQEWSQQYTLEKFETAIKEILAPRPLKGEHKKEV